MKSICAIMLLCLFAITPSFADTTVGGATPQPSVAPTAATVVDTAIQKVTADIHEQEVTDDWAVFIAMSPFILFILFFLFVLAGNGWARLFHDVLTDKDAQPIATSERPMLDAKGRQIHVNNEPKTEMVHVYPQSTSRLIMFCSSFTAIFISLSIISASIYGFLMGKGMPDFTTVIGLVLSLGIGVIPYITNKLKGNNNGASLMRNPFNPAPVNYMTSPSSRPVNTNEPPPVAPAATPTGGVQQQP